MTFTLIPSARHAAIAGSPAPVAGILTNRLGRSTSHHSSSGLRDGRRGVVGEPGVDLDRHPAVDAVGGLVDRPRARRRPAHVGGGEHPQRLADADTAAARSAICWL